VRATPHTGTVKGGQKSHVFFDVLVKERTAWFYSLREKGPDDPW